MNLKAHCCVHKHPPLILSWARCILSIPSHPISLRFILILPFHLHLGLPIGLFPSGFLTKILYTFLISPMHATCPTHLILLDKNSYRLLNSYTENFLLWQVFLPRKCSRTSVNKSWSDLPHHALDVLNSVYEQIWFFRCKKTRKDSKNVIGSVVKQNGKMWDTSSGALVSYHGNIWHHISQDHQR